MWYKSLVRLPWQTPFKFTEIINSQVFHSTTETDRNWYFFSLILVCLPTGSNSLTMLLPNIVNKSLDFCCLLLHCRKMTGWIFTKFGTAGTKVQQEPSWILILRVVLYEFWCFEHRKQIAASNLKCISKVTSAVG